MSKRMAAAASLVLLLLPAAARAADLNRDLAWCTNSGTVSEQAILGCTAAIQSRKLDKAALFWVLDNRGVDNHGVAYNRLGQYACAIQDFDRAIRLNPNDAIAYSGRSFAKRKLGDSAGAAADLAKAKAIDPDIGGAANSSSPSSNAPANNATSGLRSTLQQAAAPPNAPVGSVTAAAPANDATTGSDAIEIEYWKSIQNSKARQISKLI